MSALDGVGWVTSSHCLSPMDLVGPSWEWEEGWVPRVGILAGEGQPEGHFTYWEGGALGHQTLKERGAQYKALKQLLKNHKG